MLLDSNILIYRAKAPNSAIDSMLTRTDIAVASVTRIEVLGFHRLSEAHKEWFETIFEQMRVIGLSEAVVQRAITLRQHRKMTLADAIIAATALEHNLTLVTCNVNDFKNIPGLALIDPFQIPPP